MSVTNKRQQVIESLDYKQKLFIQIQLFQLTQVVGFYNLRLTLKDRKTMCKS